jgi:hypothetical protein
MAKGNGPSKAKPKREVDMKMKIYAAGMGLLLCALLAMGCSGHQRHHKHALSDPTEYQAHFPDMDSSGDSLVEWTEFKNHFPQTDDHVFKALDLDKDGFIDHDEWHKFKEAHGMRDH